ncbi:hypothetical protein BDV40DRAFT_184834 [Aspergillus tamarii]|uniref:Uncharacterized protein n=1 Tax=Aspergillus tamarii TaxID=41984 RepID=A0A5N6US49_ASPTM|nr:hypothetical protein BDV40DRAFT_184834 [Aspergillus tamarii]
MGLYPLQFYQSRHVLSSQPSFRGKIRCFFLLLLSGFGSHRGSSPINADLINHLWYPSDKSTISTRNSFHIRFAGVQSIWTSFHFTGVACPAHSD